jgi:hypothetical protein
VRLFIPYKAYSAADNKRILDMDKYLRVSDVSDGMDVVGLQDVGLVDQEIHALWKDTESFSRSSTRGCRPTFDAWREESARGATSSNPSTAR